MLYKLLVSDRKVLVKILYLFVQVLTTATTGLNLNYCLILGSGSGLVNRKVPVSNIAFAGSTSSTAGLSPGYVNSRF